VPEVMDDLLQERRHQTGCGIGEIAGLAVAIGTGASVGGRDRSSRLVRPRFHAGQIIRMPAGQRIALVAAGAGAGIAATFNTPIGGVMFAIELMMPEVSVETFLPVAIATGMRRF